jgi:hypothetical protein
MNYDLFLTGGLFEIVVKQIVSEGMMDIWACSLVTISP